MSAGASAFSALADLWNYFFGSENTMTTTVVRLGKVDAETQMKEGKTGMVYLKIYKARVNVMDKTEARNWTTYFKDTLVRMKDRERVKKQSQIKYDSIMSL